MEYKKELYRMNEDTMTIEVLGKGCVSPIISEHQVEAALVLHHLPAHVLLFLEVTQSWVKRPSMTCLQLLKKCQCPLFYMFCIQVGKVNKRQTYVACELIDQGYTRLFPGATGTKHHKLGALNNRNFSPHISGGRGPRRGASNGFLRGCGGSAPGLSPGSWGSAGDMLHSLACRSISPSLPSSSHVFSLWV